MSYKLPTKEERDAMRSSEKFRSTNTPWNQLKLNRAWSIGSMVNIVDNNHFSTFEAWEQHYLASGERRKMLLETIPIPVRNRLDNLRAHYEDPYNYRAGLTWDQININEAMGRTMDELKVVAKVLHKELLKNWNPLCITLDECITYTYIRVVDELYIGIQREENTIKTLEEEFPGLTFKKAKAFIDRAYCIDVEVLKSGNLVCGLQIKSPYFAKGREEAMKASQTYNLEKMQKYRDRFTAEAHFVIADVDGSLTNPEEILSELKKFA